MKIIASVYGPVEMTMTTEFLDIASIIYSRSKIQTQMKLFNNFLRQIGFAPLVLDFLKIIENAERDIEAIVNEILDTQYYVFNQQIQLYNLQISRQQLTNAQSAVEAMQIRQFARQSQKNYEIPHFRQFFEAVQRVQFNVVRGIQRYFEQLAEISQAVTKVSSNKVNYMHRIFAKTQRKTELKADPREVALTKIKQKLYRQ